MSNKDMIRARIAERVAKLGASPITLAKSVGLERGYINDILIARKRSVRRDKLALVATALECDPEYILGEQDEPRRKLQLVGMEFGGVCEAGVWRSEAAAYRAGPVGGVPIDPDPRYPGLPNLAFDVRGDGMTAEGITDGMTVSGIEASAWTAAFGPLRTGLVVAVECVRSEGREVELSLRRVAVGPDGTTLHARPTDPRLRFEPRRLGENCKVVAVITRAIRLFLDAEAGLTSPAA